MSEVKDKLPSVREKDDEVVIKAKAPGPEEGALNQSDQNRGRPQNDPSTCSRNDSERDKTILNVKTNFYSMDMSNNGTGREVLESTNGQGNHTVATGGNEDDKELVAVNTEGCTMQKYSVQTNTEGSRPSEGDKMVMLRREFSVSDKMHLF